MATVQNEPVLDGTVEVGYDRVRDACWKNIVEGKERGVQLVCWHAGRCVVNISGGRSEAARLQADTPMMVFSSGKVLESLVVAMLVDRGLLKYEQSLKSLWPELKVSQEVTVSDLMKHQAGLLPEPVPLETINDPEALMKALEKTEPSWQPSAARCIRKLDKRLRRDGFAELRLADGAGKRQGYHAISRGWFASEICRRVDPHGRTMSQFLDEEVVQVVARKDANAKDIFMGCSEEQEQRCATAESEAGVVRNFVTQLVLPRRVLPLFVDKQKMLYAYEISLLKKLARKDPLISKSLSSIAGVSPSAAEMANNPGLRKSNIPSATCCATAQALAAVVNELACLRRKESELISVKGLEAALEVQETLMDEVLCRPCTFTNAGFGQDRFDFVGLKGWYGWAGTGESEHFGRMQRCNTQLRYRWFCSCFQPGN